MIPLVFFVAGAMLVATQYRTPKLLIVLGFGYAANLALIFTQRYIRPVFYSSDQQRFLDFANELAVMDFPSYLLQFDPTGSYVISWFAALVFKVFGGDLLYVNFFFIYAWLGAIIYSYKLAQLIAGRKKIALFISMFLAITPSVSIVNAAFLRESFIIFLLTVSVYYAYSWYLTKKLPSFLKSVVLMILAGIFHGAFYFLSILLLLYYLKESLLRSRLRYLDLLFIFSFIPVLGIFSLDVAENVKVQMAVSLLSGDAQAGELFLSSEKDRSDYEGINSLTLPTIDTSSPVYFLGDLTKRVIVFVSSPFINHYYKVTDIPRIYDSLVFILTGVLFVLIYSNAWRYHDLRIEFYCKLFGPMMLLLVLMFAIGSFDVGTSQRHRLKFMPIFMVVTFATYYVQSRLARAKKISGDGGG